MPDAIVQISGGCLQHGPENDRVYVMSVEPDKIGSVMIAAEELAQRGGYGKIFVKSPAGCRGFLREQGYLEEASIRLTGNKGESEDDTFFMSRFLADSRKLDTDRQERLRILELAQSKSGSGLDSAELPAGFEWRLGEKADCGVMAELYSLVFASYPFPIEDPKFLAETMDSGVFYFGIREGGTNRLAALSSAETDPVRGMVEMTDFATHPEFRGMGFGVFLLQQMETAMRRRGFIAAYTIARAISPGMNIVFAKQGYLYGGSLINNTNICGRLESMNIWYKPLAVK